MWNSPSTVRDTGLCGEWGRGHFPRFTLVKPSEKEGVTLHTADKRKRITGKQDFNRAVIFISFL